jgi:hypothetical protein
MKLIYLLIVFILSTPVLACKSGYEPTDVPGVCVESQSSSMQASLVSDEKPPKDKMPSYEREGVKLIDAHDCTEDDRKTDLTTAQAERQGKKEAGIQ